MEMLKEMKHRRINGNHKSIEDTAEVWTNPIANPDPTLPKPDQQQANGNIHPQIFLHPDAAKKPNQITPIG